MTRLRDLCLFFGWFLLAALSTMTTAKSECSTLQQRNVTVHLGWPVILSCERVFEEIVLYDDWNYTCKMKYVGENDTFYSANFTDTVDIYWYLEYEHGDITESTPREIEIQVELLQENISCVSENVTLNIVPLKQDNCENNSLNEDFTTSPELKQGDAYALDCEVESEPYFDIWKYNVTWLFDCGSDLPNGTSDTNEKLTIASPNYKLHPGLYSCFVTHNGERRFIFNHRVCIQPDVGLQTVQMTCSEPRKNVEKGQTAIMECNVDADEKLYQQDYTIRINKLLSNGSDDLSSSNSSCLAVIPGEWATADDDPNVSCRLSYIKEYSHGVTCFNSSTSDEQWENELQESGISELRLTYQIKNYGDEYSGKYRAYIKNDFSYDTSKACFEFITVSKNPETQAKAIGIAVGSVLGLMLIIGLCIALRIEIQWVWRQCFTKYDLNAKEYGAYVKHYWSGEDGKMKNEKYPHFINHLKTTLKKMNCPTYDTQENLQQYRWNHENILNVQQKCDRIIVILTPEYLMNDEDIFDIYANFLDSTFVFVKTPGVDKTMKEMKSDKKCVMQAALRRNYVIEWSGHGRYLSGRFKRKLELAMPKRRKDEPGLLFTQLE